MSTMVSKDKELAALERVWRNSGPEREPVAKC